MASGHQRNKLNESLINQYKLKKILIQNRLKDFKAVWQQPDKKIFAELCFCICTPQSKAVYCDKAINYLEKTGILFTGNFKEIRERLIAVRFPNNKTKYILEARDLLKTNGQIKIKEKIDLCDIFKTRLWLFENIKGLGLKESSHFLRNIGFGKDLAILDVHIIKNLVLHGIIKEKPKNLSEKMYFELENKLKDFSDKIKIPMDELDILFWSKETGEIFK